MHHRAQEAMMQAADHHPERRSGRRFALRAPVFFTVWTKSGTSATRSGTTRDVGPGGLFFRTDAARGIEPDRRVSVRLVITQNGIPSSQTPVALSAEGRVVRKEELPANRNSDNGASRPQWGIAVQFLDRPLVDLASTLLDPSLSPSPS
jgi:hypothetical protein